MRTTHLPEHRSFGPPFNTKPSHRLFFGIWPDAGATDQLTQLTARLHKQGIMPGRPVDPDRLHITLHRLGDYADQMPPTLLPAARAAAATVKLQPFDVAFDRVGGTRGQFLLRPSDGSPALRAFRQRLSAALIKAGLRGNVNPVFGPHMTLSYDFSDAPEQFIDPIHWTVRQFVLIDSLLGKHRHVKRGCWPLDHHADLYTGYPSENHSAPHSRQTWLP